MEDYNCLLELTSWLQKERSFFWSSSCYSVQFLCNNLVVNRLSMFAVVSFFSLPNLWLSASCRVESCVQDWCFMEAMESYIDHKKCCLTNKFTPSKVGLKMLTKMAKITINPIDEQTEKENGRKKMASFAHHERTPFSISPL